MRTELRNNWFSFLRRFLPRRYLCAVLLITFVSISFAQAQENIIELTNADVIAMVRNKTPVSTIVNTIQTSNCHFDTFPPVISELRYRGVPEEVLLAMVEAPIGRPTRSSQSATSSKPATPKPEESASASTVKISTQPSNPKPGSVNATENRGRTKIVKTPAATVRSREKSAIEPTSMGKAPSRSVKTASKDESDSSATTATVKPPANTTAVAPIPRSQKENSNTIYASLPLPEPVRLESAISTSPIVSDAVPTQIASLNAVDSAPAITQPVKPTSQPATPQTLTNADVIKLLRAGSSHSEVVEAIRAAPGNYDLSAKALLELRDAGADATVFLSMMETNQKAVEKVTPQTPNESVQNKKPEKKNN